MTTIEWRKVPSAPEYEVSNIGDVRRIVAAGRWKSQRAGPGNLLKPTPNKKGYLRLTVETGDGRKKTTFVARLVCEAFNGPPPSPRHHAAHWDGNKQNNVPDNLRWATPAENIADNWRLGRILRGPLHGRSLLDEQEAAEFVAKWRELPRSRPGRVADGVGQRLAAEFGISPSTARAMARREQHP